MKTFSRERVVAGVVMLLLLAAGCARKQERPHVEGKVTYHGRPVGNQTLILVSEGVPPDRFTRSLALLSDGTFSGEAPVPGNYKIVIERSLAAMEGRPLAGADAVTIPQKYRSAETTDLVWSIQPGQNTREFELTD